MEKKAQVGDIVESMGGHRFRYTENDTWEPVDKGGMNTPAWMVVAAQAVCVLAAGILTGGAIELVLHLVG